MALLKPKRDALCFYFSVSFVCMFRKYGRSVCVCKYKCDFHVSLQEHLIPRHGKRALGCVFAWHGLDEVVSISPLRKTSLMSLYNTHTNTQTCTCPALLVRPLIIEHNVFPTPYPNIQNYTKCSSLYPKPELNLILYLLIANQSHSALQLPYVCILWYQKGHNFCCF